MIMENLALILSAQFLVFVLLVFLNFRDLAKPFRDIKKITWTALIIIIMLTPLLFLYSPPPVFVEDLTIAKEFVVGGDFFVKNPRYGPFYAYLIHLSFLVSGVNSVATNYFEALFLVLAVFGIFLLSYFITKKELFSLISSGMYLLVMLTILYYDLFQIYMFIVHSLLAFSLLFILFSYKEDNWKAYSLALVTIYFAGMVRFEMMILFYVFLTGILIFRWEHLKGLKRFKPLLVRLSIPLVIFLVFSLVYFVHIDYNTHKRTGHELSPIDEVISKGVFWPSIDYFSMDYVGKSLEGFFGFLMSPILMLFMVSSAIGLYLMVRNYRGEAVFLIIAFLIMLSPYLSCVTCFQPKYFLYILIPLLVFSAYAIYRLTGPLHGLGRLNLNVQRRTLFAGLLLLLAGFSYLYSLPLSPHGSVIEILERDPVYKEFYEISDTINTLSGEGENESVVLITYGLKNFDEIRFLTLKRTAPLSVMIQTTEYYHEHLADVEHKKEVISGYSMLFYNESAIEEVQGIREMILERAITKIEDEYDKGNDPLLIRSMDYDTIYFLYSSKCDSDIGRMACGLVTENFNSILLAESDEFKLYLLTF